MVMRKMTSRSVGAALAALTETYTDSENEDDIEEEYDDPLKGFTINHSLSIESVAVQATITEDNKPFNPLVFYNDDAQISDEEGIYENDRERRRSSGVEDSEIYEEDDDVRLPPEPAGRCSNELQEKITRLHDRMLGGDSLNMNTLIQQRKDFRNPSIYEKLIQYCNINELGTNYPAQRYDPLRWGKESFYEELARVQKAEMDKREKERKERTKVEFVSGTAKKPSAPNSEEDSRKRKSKWDQVGSAVAPSNNSTATNNHNLLKSTAFLQASLTSNVTGTKGTIISAFGSLPKKPKL